MINQFTSPNLKFLSIIIISWLSLQSCKKDSDENNNDIKGDYQGLFINDHKTLDMYGWHEHKDSTWETVTISHINDTIGEQGDIILVHFQVPAYGNLTSNDWEFSFDSGNLGSLTYKTQPCIQGGATVTYNGNEKTVTLHVSCSDLSYSYSWSFNGTK